MCEVLHQHHSDIVELRQRIDALEQQQNIFKGVGWICSSCGSIYPWQTIECPKCEKQRIDQGNLVERMDQ